jgi:hypothetical protein
VAKKNKMSAKNTQNQNQFNAEFAEEAAGPSDPKRAYPAAKQQMNK